MSDEQISRKTFPSKLFTRSFSNRDSLDRSRSRNIFAKRSILVATNFSKRREDGGRLVSGHRLQTASLSISLDTLSLRVQTDDCQGISRELAAGRDSSSFRSRLPRPRPLLPWTKLKGAIAIFQQKRGSMVEGVYVRLGDFGVSNFRRRHPSREPTPSLLPPLSRPRSIPLALHPLSAAATFGYGTRVECVMNCLFN